MSWNGAADSPKVGKGPATGGANEGENRGTDINYLDGTRGKPGEGQKSSHNAGKNARNDLSRRANRQSLYFSETYNREFLDNYFYVSKDESPHNEDGNKGNLENKKKATEEDPQNQNFWVESCVQESYCRDGVDDICNGLSSFLMNRISSDKTLATINETTVSVGRDGVPDGHEARWLDQLDLSAASKSFRNLAVILTDSGDKPNNQTMFQPPGLKKSCNWYRADNQRNAPVSDCVSPDDDHHPTAFYAYNSKTISDTQFEAMYGMSRGQFVLLSKASHDSSSQFDATSEQPPAKTIGRENGTSATDTTEELSISDASSTQQRAEHKVTATVE